MTDTDFSFDNNLYICKVTADKKKCPPYLRSIPAVAQLFDRGIEFKKRITVFMGENGIGKSTLLEAIAAAYGFNPEGGTRNFSFSTYNSHSELYGTLKLSRGGYPKDGFFLRAESFYNVASEIERLDNIPAASPPIIDGYGGVSLHEQSHGESFMALAMNRFRGHGLYILDEPEAALSPTAQMALLARLYELARNDSQLIIATHSVIISALPDADVYEITEKGINKTEYVKTSHYNIMKHFINSPEKMVSDLTGKER